MGDPRRYLAWLGLLAISTCITSGSLYHDQFDKSIEAFLLDNGYTGGSIAAMKDRRIIYAKGYGVNEQGHDVKATSLTPISSISQTITAVGILQLSEIDALDLDGKVFGHGGYLHMFKGYDPKSIDPRLHDITVRHLLHHSAGWDLSKEPLYDPMLNTYYLKKGLNVTDIGKIMKSEATVTYYDTINYVLSQKLDFTPGTKTVYSNLGYSILGRIIEEVADTSYEDFVKQNILKPCGMWHTRLGSKAKIEKVEKLKSTVHGDTTAEDVTIFDVIHPVIIDSTLGWYSNAYDMIRFLRCIEDHVGTGLLNKKSLEIMLQKPVAAPVQHSENWYGAGLHANTLGSFWQGGEKHTGDVLIFHSHKHTHDIPMPDAWVFLLHGHKLGHLKHKAHALMEYLGVEFAGDEMILKDLSDVQLPSTVVKYHVEEHHLHAYINALKQESFDLTWISGYDALRHTKFAIVAEKVDTMKDYLAEHGFTEKKLQTRKLDLENEGYNMTFMQNYKSYSHDEQHAFLAVFRKDAYDKDTHMKWGIHHFPRPYEKLLGLYHEKGYYPTVQSHLHLEDEALISFIFIKSDKHPKVDFKEYHGLSIPALEGRVVPSNANENRKLAYIDVAMVYNKPRFSAVFRNDNHRLWVFAPELTRSAADKFIEEKFQHGYHPTMIVGYARTSKTIKYAVYVEKMDTGVKSGATKSN